MIKILAITQFLLLLSSVMILGKSTFSAQLASFPSTEYRLVYQQNMLNAYRGKVLAEGKSDINGKFSLSFSITSPQPLLLFIGNQFFKIWFTPEASLHFKEAEGRFEFNGTNALENKFLFDTQLMQPYTVNPVATSTHFEPDSQITYLSQLEKERWQQYRNTIAHQNVSPIFQSFVTGEINGFTFLQKSQYPQRFIYMTKTLRIEDIPENYYVFWKEFQLLEDATPSDIYHQSLQAFIEFKAKSKVGHSADMNSLYQTEFALMDSLLKGRPLTLQRQKAEAIRFLIQYTDLNKLSQKAIRTLYNDFPSSPYVVFLEKEWRKKTKTILSSPSFRLRDSQGNLVDSKDLKGKVVYIDFWGSWCQPCIALMPSSEKLQQKFKNQPVVFLFINFHDSKEKWLKTLQQRQLTGLHLKAEKENEAYFQEVFGIGEGFPRYALLDREGKLQSTAAPRPDSPEIVPLLEKFIKNEQQLSEK